MMPQFVPVSDQISPRALFSTSQIHFRKCRSMNCICIARNSACLPAADAGRLSEHRLQPSQQRAERKHGQRAHGFLAKVYDVSRVDTACLTKALRVRLHLRIPKPPPNPNTLSIGSCSPGDCNQTPDIACELASTRLPQKKRYFFIALGDGMSHASLNLHSTK
jgi:hypothetical protein